MSEFEEVVQGLFTDDEVTSMADRLKAFSEFTAQEDPSCDANITERRIGAFAEACAFGYADNLYDVMEHAGFTSKYLDFIKGIGAIRGLPKE